MDSLGISGSSVLFSKLFTANPHDLSQRTEFPKLIWICSHVKDVNKIDLHFRHQYICINGQSRNRFFIHSWLVQGTVILDSRENDRTCAGWKCTRNIICRNLKPPSFSGKKILTISFVHCQFLFSNAVPDFGCNSNWRFALKFRFWFGFLLRILPSLLCSNSLMFELLLQFDMRLFII